MGHKTLKFFESYECARDCKTPTGWDRKTREGRGCTRVDLHPVKWDVDAARLHAPRRDHDADLYKGRPPDPALEGTIDLRPVNHAIPLEPSSDGCPGGWYRTPWASSVIGYRRRRTEGGGRVENGLLRGASKQVWAAVLELERQEERAHNYASERARAISERAAKARRNGR